MHPNDDPVLRTARRELAIVIVVWVVAFAYTCGYCYRFGYGRDIGTLTFVWGFPDWIFWGILVPWAACLVFSIVFAFGIMRDEPLGAEEHEEDGGNG